MNSEVDEIPFNEKLYGQQDDGVSCYKLTDMNSFAVMAFENPGLYHIGDSIFKNLDIQTKLNGRLVNKSWNDVFEKQASKIDLKKVPE